MPPLQTQFPTTFLTSHITPALIDAGVLATTDANNGTLPSKTLTYTPAVWENAISGTTTLYYSDDLTTPLDTLTWGASDTYTITVDDLEKSIVVVETVESEDGTRASTQSNDVPILWRETAFDQVWSAELLATPSLDAWTDPTHPDGWTLGSYTPGTAFVEQTAEDGSAGTGAAHVVASATNTPNLNQNVATSGEYCATAINITHNTLGNWRHSLPGGGGLTSGAGAGVKRLIGTATASTVYLNTNGVADMVWGSASYKRLTTPNTPYEAKADGVAWIDVSAAAWDAGLASLDFAVRWLDWNNYIGVRIKQDRYLTNFSVWLYKCVAGVETNLISVAVAGTGITLLKLVMSGNDYHLYTYVGATPTDRGTATDSFNATQTKITFRSADEELPAAITWSGGEGTYLGDGYVDGGG